MVRYLVIERGEVVYQHNQFLKERKISVDEEKNGHDGSFSSPEILDLVIEGQKVVIEKRRLQSKTVST